MRLLVKKKKIIWPQDAECLKRKRVGGKAGNLARLWRRGLAVPDFFVLPTTLYQMFRQWELSHRHDASLPAGVVEQVFGARFTQHLISAVSQLAEPVLVSVRSSAVGEDHGLQSQAGQYATVLNVSAPEQLLAAILRVWQSASGKDKDSAPNAGAMAVIVQKMIPADYAGVLFTCNPVTGDCSQVVIEITPGTADHLVGGKVQPERLVFPGPHGPTVAAPPMSRYLTSDQIKQLLDVGAAIEQLMGPAQDIEWAWHKDTCYILQARPITTLLLGGTRIIQRQGRIWSNYFFAERFPDAISPLGWSFLQPPFEKNAFKYPLYCLGFDAVANRDLTRAFDGQPFSDLEAFRKLYSVIPGALIPEDKRQAFFIRSDTSHWLLTLLRALPFLLIRLLLRDFSWFLPYHLQAWQKFLRRYLRQIEHLNSALSGRQPDLAAIWRECEALTDEILSYHRWSITFADLFFRLVEKCLAAWTPAKQPAAELFKNLPGNITMAMNAALFKLVRHFRQADHPAGPQEIQASPIWQDFIAKYGAYCESLDLARPNWRQNPDFIFDIIARTESMPRLATPTNPEQIQATILASIRKPVRLAGLKRNVLRILIRWTTPLMLLRENQRFYWQQVLGLARTLSYRVGQELFPAQPEAIYQFSKDEFKDYLHQRREPGYFQRQLPLRQSRLSESVFTTDQATLLTGLGVSPGRIEGRTRILRSLQDAHKACPGDILVTSGMDPGWSPLLAFAGGIVAEVGGMLSHGSILAREFGVPAITGIAHATQLIPENAQVILDGNAGSIQIIKEA